ncbi:hypothetical protein [Comamonas aquatica]|nr:hypothetical protein [Comamonas aquatica]
MFIVAVHPGGKDGENTTLLPMYTNAVGTLTLNVMRGWLPGVMVMVGLAGVMVPRTVMKLPTWYFLVSVHK